jgi:hypothetical protein
VKRVLVSCSIACYSEQRTALDEMSLVLNMKTLHIENSSLSLHVALRIWVKVWIRMEGGMYVIVYNDALLHPQVTSVLTSEYCIVMHRYLHYTA